MAYRKKARNKEDEESEDVKKDEKEKKRSRRPRLTHSQWWRAKDHGKDPHEILNNVVKQIEDDQDSRYTAYKEYERAFGATVGPNGDDSFNAMATDEVTQNELQSTLETLWAQIFKNKIVPAVSVSESDWEEWDRARSYSRWLEGAFDEAGVYDTVFPKAGMNFLVHGTGIIRVGWEDVSEGDKKLAKVKCWPVNPRYVFVDRLEAKHGRPRSIYFKDHVDRYVLMATYGCEDEDFYGSTSERIKGIEEAPANDDFDEGNTSVTRCDMVKVWEAFHLPSGPRSGDGRHVIWTEKCTLVDREFTWDRFPGVFMRFGCPMEGFWGESAVRRLAPTQKLLDKLTKKIDECQDVMGVPRIIVGAGAGTLKTEHIDDIPGAIISVDNPDKIKDWNAQCATQELYADRDNAPRRMRNLLGVSDFEATTQLPPGLRDVGAPFMERFVEQGQARHAMSHGQYEAAVPALAELFAMQAQELQEKGYDLIVKAPAESNKSSVEELEFKDVVVDIKRLKMRVQPMSQLPQTFGGKVDAFEKMKQAGLPVDPKTALRMMEVPDLAGQTDLLVSDEEIIMKNLAHMCRTGEYMAPMPFDNLDLIVQLTTRYINRYRVRRDADSYKVALLAQYIDDAVLLKKGLGAQDPNAPPSVSTMGALGLAGPMGMPPPGAPGMPPGMPPMGPQGMPPGPPMAGPPGVPPPDAMPPGAMPPGPMM